MTKPTGRPKGRPLADPQRPCSRCGRDPFPLLVTFSTRLLPSGRRTRDSICIDCRSTLNRRRRRRARL